MTSVTDGAERPDRPDHARPTPALTKADGTTQADWPTLGVDPAGPGTDGPSEAGTADSGSKEADAASAHPAPLESGVQEAQPAPAEFSASAHAGDRTGPYAGTSSPVLTSPSPAPDPDVPVSAPEPAPGVEPALGTEPSPWRGVEGGPESASGPDASEGAEPVATAEPTKHRPGESGSALRSAPGEASASAAPVREPGPRAGNGVRPEAKHRFRMMRLRRSKSGSSAPVGSEPATGSEGTERAGARTGERVRADAATAHSRAGTGDTASRPGTVPEPDTHRGRGPDRDAGADTSRDMGTDLPHRTVDTKPPLGSGPDSAPGPDDDADRTPGPAKGTGSAPGPEAVRASAPAPGSEAAHGAGAEPDPKATPSEPVPVLIPRGQTGALLLSRLLASSIGRSRRPSDRSPYAAGSDTRPGLDAPALQDTVHPAAPGGPATGGTPEGPARASGRRGSVPPVADAYGTGDRSVTGGPNAADGPYGADGTSVAGAPDPVDTPGTPDDSATPPKDTGHAPSTVTGHAHGTDDTNVSHVQPASRVPGADPVPEAGQAPAEDPAEEAVRPRANLTPKDPAPADGVPGTPTPGHPGGRRAERTAEAAPSRTEWDDGLIARRAAPSDGVNDVVDLGAGAGGVSTGAGRPGEPGALYDAVYDAPLRDRLDALRELVGLSRTRVDSDTLAEAGRVLDEAVARGRLSAGHTVVALAGATGSGKSSLFNALAGVTLSDTGLRRPTTSLPVACSWTDDAAPLLDRLGVPARLRRRPPHDAEADGRLRGLVLVDLPDHDSAAVAHREQVDRILALVDGVIWVVDPEKYADAVLHDRYLRPMAGHAEVMFVVLNQVDRLPGDAADQVLDDLRRLLDEDGVALGEHGEPGTTVLAVSAATGRGVGELRAALGHFVAERGAAGRRIAADVDAAAGRLRPVYGGGSQVGLSEEAREEFADRLAEAIGAAAAGVAAERAWLRNAGKACGSPWLRLWHWYEARRFPRLRRPNPQPSAAEEATARQRVEQAVRWVADQASAGLPAPWALAVREAAVRGARGLPRALDELAAKAGSPTDRPPRPGWWPAAVLAQAAMTILQVFGGLWLVGQILGLCPPNLGVPVLLMLAGIVGGPLVDWACRTAARGPARRYGLEAERRLRDVAAACGRARVLDPVSAELLRYAEVREQYVRVLGERAAVARVG